MIIHFVVRSLAENIDYSVWEADKDTKAVIVFAHGITDHHSRYEDF